MGVSLGSFLFPRQDNHVQMCIYTQYTGPFSISMPQIFFILVENVTKMRMAAFGEDGNGECLVISPLFRACLPQRQRFMVRLVQENFVRLISWHLLIDTQKFFKEILNFFKENFLFFEKMFLFFLRKFFYFLRKCFLFFLSKFSSFLRKFWTFFKEILNFFEEIFNFFEKFFFDFSRKIFKFFFPILFWNQLEIC